MQSALYIAAILTTFNGRFVEYDAAVKAWETGTPMVVILSAEWCGPCKQLQSDFVKFNGNHVAVKLDIEKDAIANRFPRVESLPTTYVFRLGKPTVKVVGNEIATLRKALE